jgi:hypothetical protein
MSQTIDDPREFRAKSLMLLQKSGLHPNSMQPALDDIDNLTILKQQTGKSNPQGQMGGGMFGVGR